MSITIAETAGFCYGVKRAVDEAYKLAAEEGKFATLGELIHNSFVVADLENKGIKAYERVEDIPKDTTVILRTHGVSADVIGEIEKRGMEYRDLTCPFVAKIHKIVKKHYEEGYKIVIIGDENHPEVKGINGWCNNEAFITYSTEQNFDGIFNDNKVCVVAQTTINRKIFGQIVQNIKKTCQDPLIFDTICSATRDRQSEAEELAEHADVMLVVGGKHSSNTKKLFEICKGSCPETYLIETYEDIPHGLYKNKRIGITAGASTPGCIIEEVLQTMDEKMKTEENFAELFAQYENKSLNNGDIIDGTVVEVRGNEVIVELDGFKYNGQLAADQLTEDPYLKPEDIVKVGEKITVYVVGVNDAEGKVVLSRKKLVAMESWNRMKEAYENGTVLDAKIIKTVRGGVIALADSYRIFVPARQVALRFVQDLESLLNQDIRIKITEMDDKRKRVVGSARVILEEERKAVEDKFWADVEVGKEYTGTVKSLTAFGAFVDIGGVDGLIHISELSWNKIKHPSEVVAEGDVVTVYIKDINAETKKISLGYKKSEDNPWVIAENKIHVGDVVDCKIVRMMPFGAFAEIMPNIDGLIHISQIADKRIGKPEDVLEIGQEVQAKVTEANWETKKISLSIRALIEPEVKEEAAEEVAETAPVFEEDAPVDIEKFIAEEAAAEETEAPAEVVEEAVEETVAEEAVEEVAEEAAEETTEE